MNRFSSLQVAAVAIANTLMISAQCAQALDFSHTLIANNESEEEPRREGPPPRAPQPGRNEAAMQQQMQRSQQQGQRQAEQQARQAQQQQQRQAEQQARQTQQQEQRQAELQSREAQRNQQKELKEEQKAEQDQARQNAKMQEQQARQEKQIEQEQGRFNQGMQGRQNQGMQGRQNPVMEGRENQGMQGAPVPAMQGPPGRPDLEQPRFKNPAVNGFGEPGLREEEHLPNSQKNAFVRPGERVRWTGGSNQPVANAHGWHNRPPLPPSPVRHMAPFEKASPPPEIIQNASPEQQQMAQRELQNLQAHVAPIPLSQAPPNYQNYFNAQAQAYFSSPTPFYINGMPIYINPQNTAFIPMLQSQWPAWYQPNPNWVYATGYSLGNAIEVGMNWLMGGWQPYYGPNPTGFICAANYFPTPWTYNPAYNSWMQPGISTFMDSPNEGYTGPITVQVVEPETIWEPNTFGRSVRRVINQMYLYDAFYYPQYGRWGYVNRHNYFVWLNI